MSLATVANLRRRAGRRDPLAIAEHHRPLLLSAALGQLQREPAAMTMSSAPPATPHPRPAPPAPAPPSSSSLFHPRAYEAVQAVVSDDNNHERGAACARAVADAVLAEAGAAGLREMTVVLSLKLVR